jgi:hypothetical protein
MRLSQHQNRISKFGDETTQATWQVMRVEPAAKLGGLRIAATWSASVAQREATPA